MAANNKANVSTTRAVKGGYAFSAPVGTPGAPTKSNYHASQWLTNGEPPAGWECLGFIVEDGFTEGHSKDSGEKIRDINLDTLDETEGTTDEAVTVGFREIKQHVLGTAFGHENVTDENGTIEVDHNWSKSEEHYQYVFLLLLKNGRAWTKYVPDGKVSGFTDYTYNKTTPIDTEVEISYITDESGSGCKDWIDSTETPAPALTALSGTNLTLSPTFSASTRTYTATSSSASTTITATAATGNTVSIKDGNGNTYSSGGSVPLVTGKNVLIISVTNTNSGAVGLYTLTVTKS